MYGSACFFVFLLFSNMIIEASISKNFYDFMKEKHGQIFADKVARYDFGPFGSFGGGNHIGGTKTNHTPSIFVHGWNLNAAAYELLTGHWLSRKFTMAEVYGTTNRPVVFVHGFGGVTADYEPLKLNWMLLGGYSDAELYGTTYGIPSIPFMSLLAYHQGCTCDYVKNVRNLIIGVSEYTNSTVNVLSYSMGGPVSRKAILGGKCVDTYEDLGPPLTNLVENYLGVAGAMKGAIMCLAPVGVCSIIDGMLCHSAFMRDINRQKHYEGKNTYVIQSISDEIVGYLGCGGFHSQIDGANKTITLAGLLHLGVIGLTGPLQYALVSSGKVENLPKGQKYQIS